MGAFVTIIIMYYLIDYQIRLTIKDELRSMRERKYKKMKMLKNNKAKSVEKDTYSKNEEPSHDMNQADMDSYMDPLQNQGDDFDNHVQHNQKRISKNDIMMRNFVDGTH